MIIMGCLDVSSLVHPNHLGGGFKQFVFFSNPTWRDHHFGNAPDVPWVVQPPSHARDFPPMSFSEAHGSFFGPIPILWTIHVGRHHWISLADAYRSLPEHKKSASEISEE